MDPLTVNVLNACVNGDSAMQPFELNRHGKIIFPSNFLPDLDFSTFDSLEQLDAVVRRDFDTKAPTGTDILAQIENSSYANKFELMRDMALNLFWANRFALTMYDVRPTRWADVPRTREDVFVPIQTPWQDSDAKVSAVESAYPNLPARWDAAVEDDIFDVLFDVFGHRRNHATELSAVIPTVAALLSDPGHQTLRLTRYDPDFRRYSYDEMLDCNEDVAELEALRRWSMVRTTNIPGIAGTPPSSKSASLRTMTTWWPFTPATARCSASSPGSPFRQRPESAGRLRHPRRWPLLARTPPSTCAMTSRCSPPSWPSPSNTASRCAPMRI